MKITITELIKTLDGWSSHRGDKSAHCCLTGKDADLESHGQQDITLNGVESGYVHCTVTVGKTFAGSDICLNLPEDRENDDEFYERAREEWLDQATEVVCGCGVAGEWDGDSWYMHEGIDFRVLLHDTAEATAKAIMDEACKAIAPLERELVLADEILNQLSGWTDGKGNAFPAGKPGEGSVGYYLAKDWNSEWHTQEGDDAK